MAKKDLGIEESNVRSVVAFFGEHGLEGLKTGKSSVCLRYCKVYSAFGRFPDFKASVATFVECRNKRCDREIIQF